ncbi:hypothetical protein LJK87_01320 [Paenibacillus sp. P25]|nr:hypothetical protein LJK87_01320 [Paenibacillus sp. P25]
MIYTVAPFAGGLYATSELDGGTGLTVNPSANLSSLSTPGVRAPYSEADAMLSWFAGTVDEVTAKDTSGNKVQLPNKIIRSISVSNASAAEVVAKPKNDSVAFDVYGIRGKRAGTTSVLVSFYPSHSTGLRTRCARQRAGEEGLSRYRFFERRGERKRQDGLAVFA